MRNENRTYYERFTRSSASSMPMRQGARQPTTRVVSASARHLPRFLRELRRETDDRVWYIADENTLAAVPEVLAAIDPESGSLLPAYPPLIPAIETAETVARDGSEARVMVAVGSGTVTDIAKYAAFISGASLISIPTASSVDAYTSEKSALRIDGYHRTPVARVPDVVVTCPDVIEAQPNALALAGVGDLIAKLIARIDWQVSNLITGEPIHEKESWWSTQAARVALARFRRTGLAESSERALDALLVTGRAMLQSGSSRPAASAEHTLAHLWEVALTEEHLHGALVASGIDAVLPAYREICKMLVEARSAASSGSALLSVETGWKERVPGEMSSFRGKMEEESQHRALDEKTIDERQRRINENREQIARVASSLVDEAERALAVLWSVGGTPAVPKIDEAWKSKAIRWVKYLRNRYSLFDLAFEMGWEEEVYERIGV